jgi:hypothetical protein
LPCCIAVAHAFTPNPRSPPTTSDLPGRIGRLGVISALPALQDVVPACGNGFLDPGEQCDGPGPACTPNCTYPRASPSIQLHATSPSPATPQPAAALSSAPPLSWGATTISAGSPGTAAAGVEAHPPTQPLSPPTLPTTPPPLPSPPAGGLGATQQATSEPAATSSIDSIDGVDPTVDCCGGGVADGWDIRHEGEGG